MEDQTLYCRHCGREFAFTAGEQEFYARKQLVGPPGRCSDCRKARRQGLRAQNNYSGQRGSSPQSDNYAYSAARRQRQP